MATQTGPVLVVSNHSAWWDPLVAIWLTTAFESYAVMDAANLARFPFFGKVGAIGVDRTRPHHGARIIRSCARLLTRPGRLLWIFAQGAEHPLHGPITFEGGAAAIARLCHAPVLHVAIHYAFNERERPDLDIVIGAPTTSVSVEAVRELLTQVPARETVFEAPTGHFAARLLAWLTQSSTR